MKPVLAAGAAAGVTVPVVWDFLGFRFEAGPLVITICATLMTRLIVSLQSRGHHRYLLDVTVTALSVLVAVLWTQAKSLALLPAGLSGIGFGALGVSIISLAKSPIGIALKAAFGAFLSSAAANSRSTDAIKGDQDEDLLRELEKHD